MGCSIFLCDRNWNMEKIFYSSGLELRKGDSLAEWLPEAEETGRKLEGENSGQVLLFLECSDGRKVPLFLFLYPAHVLAVLGRADERDFISFEKALVKSLDWADRHLREPYEDDFYEIQHMNNRLVNAGRDLMKANRRLTGLLEEVRKAHRAGRTHVPLHTLRLPEGGRGENGKGRKQGLSHDCPERIRPSPGE